MVVLVGFQLYIVGDILLFKNRVIDSFVFKRNRINRVYSFISSKRSAYISIIPGLLWKLKRILPFSYYLMLSYYINFRHFWVRLGSFIITIFQENIFCWFSTPQITHPNPGTSLVPRTRYLSFGHQSKTCDSIQIHVNSYNS